MVPFGTKALSEIKISTAQFGARKKSIKFSSGIQLRGQHSMEGLYEYINKPLKSTS